MARKIPTIPAGNQAFPCHRHLEYSSPQTSVQDKKIISAVFAGPVISEGFGKLPLFTHNSLNCTDQLLRPKAPWTSVCGPLFSPNPPLPISAALGSLSSAALKYLGYEGKGMPKIQGKITFWGFYYYLIEEEQAPMVNPVKRGHTLRLSRPLPRHLRDEEVERLIKVGHRQQDRFMVMLVPRCGLRVEKVARLKLAALDLRRSLVFVHQGKGAKDRVVYLSDDAYEALVQYLRVRPASRIKEVFLVDKKRCRGKAISVRGIQKRLEHYARQGRASHRGTGPALATGCRPPEFLTLNLFNHLTADQGVG